MKHWNMHSPQGHDLSVWGGSVSRMAPIGLAKCHHTADFNGRQDITNRCPLAIVEAACVCCTKVVSKDTICAIPMTALWLFASRSLLVDLTGI